MTDCSYCDKEFSSDKEKLDHELEEHSDEMTGHEKSDKKSELNKLEQKKQTAKHNKKKKLQYAGISVLALLVLGGSGFALYQQGALGAMTGASTTNASIGVGEFIHWHADYDITVCGQDRILQGGPIQAHTHGEKTFHMEGTRTSEEQATLDWIVDELGGELEENSILGQTQCNGEPANLTVTVNGEEVDNHLDYIVRNEDRVELTLE
jgi:hypothetical protein